MGKAEGKLETHLKERIKDLGGFCRKYTSPGRRGVPDQIVFWHGVCFIELKTDKGVLSKLQELEIDRMRAAGAEVVVLDTLYKIDAWIRDRRNDETKLYTQG